MTTMGVAAFMAPLPYAPVAPLTRGLPGAVNVKRIMYLPGSKPLTPRSLLAPSLRRQYAASDGGNGSNFGGGGGGFFGDWGRDEGDGQHESIILLNGIASRYSRELLVRPYRTKAITTGILMMLSDYLAQILTRPVLQAERLIRYLFYGFAIAGPATHWWFSLIEKHCSKGLLGAVQMSALDQFIAAPVLLAAFILFMHMSEGQSIRGNESELRDKHKDALAASIRVWPVVNMINFSVVPSQYRVVFGSVFNVLWIAYLSVATNSGEQTLDDSVILSNNAG